MKTIIFFFLFFFSFQVNAISLSNQLDSFFKREYPNHEDDINVILRTQLINNIHCIKPFFSFFSTFPSLGNIDVLLTCNKEKYYLQVELQAIGKYVVSKRKLPHGSKIKESDLTTSTGRLDLLPSQIYRNKKEIINRVNIRDILPFQPITSFMTRPFWLVRFNQPVTVIINGHNFTIFSKGISLNNGAKNENIRVKIKNGKIITGTVNDNGQVIVSF